MKKSFISPANHFLRRRFCQTLQECVGNLLPLPLPHHFRKRRSLSPSLFLFPLLFSWSGTVGSIDAFETRDGKKQEELKQIFSRKKIIKYV